MTRTKQIAAGAGLALAGVGGLNALMRMRAGRLPETLPEGERHEYRWRKGRVSYHVAGQGDPLLLVHGVFAGACNYEWRRTFGFLARHFRVFAPDLLGFGHSDRPHLEYTDDLYTSLLHDFVRDVTDSPVCAVADSVSCNFLVADAAANPGDYRGLILVTPQPIGEGNGRAGIGRRAYGALLRTPVLGTALYNSIVSRRSIEAELHKVYERPDAFGKDTVRFYHKSSHQAGSRWAATSFIGGDLERNLRGEFRSLQVPVLLVWGDDAAYSPVGNAAAYLAANPRAELKVFAECGNLPHEEYSAEFNHLVLERFARAPMHLTVMEEPVEEYQDVAG